VLAAAAAYAAITYAAGFALGVVRTLFVAPAVGPFVAVLLETPLILAASWFVCGWVVRRFAVSPAATTRLGLGALAFVFLTAIEWLMGTLLFHRTPGAIVAGYATAAGLAGLAAQLAFAAMRAWR
jgi:ABC-type uncharacterized transport system permease subunit